MRNRPGDREPGLSSPLRLAASYSWRLLVVAAAVIALGVAVSELRLVAMALFLALCATALLRPPVERLRMRGCPAAIASLSVLAIAVVTLAAVLLVVVPRFVGQLDELGASLQEGTEAAAALLERALSEEQLERYVDRGVESLRDNSDVLLGGLFSGALLLLEVLVGTLLALVLTFFFLRDGEEIWGWMVSLSPAEVRVDVLEVGKRAWTTLGGYLRGVTLVALFDALLIGLALALVGVPAALSLAVLTFFGAYVPIAGAVITGLAAVLVALVANGPVAAGVVAAAVLVVQQLESNLLQPVVVGRAVSLHPVATLLSVVSGAVIAGIVGALVAVPTVAVLARAGGYLRERNRAPRHAAAAEPAEAALETPVR